MSRVVIVVLSATAVVLGAASAASAHADLVTSDPASGATLPTAPTTLRLTFSEAPDPSLSAVDLLDTGGSAQPLGAPTLDGPTTLVVPITGSLPDGVYTVSWRAVSADDGHVTAGAFPFGVGTAPGGAPTASTTPTTSGPTPLGVASKALLYAGTMLLVAIAVVGLALFHDAPAARRTVGVWSAIAAVAGALGFLVAQQRSIGVPMGAYLRSEAGRDPLWIAIACVVALILAAAGARSSRRWFPWTAGAVAAIALGLRAHGGHAASAADPSIAELTQWIHMLAGACWAGGLVLLVLLLRERRHDPPIAEARRYSTMAVAAIAIVVASGLLRAFSILGGFHGLANTLSTTYGTTLAVKVTAVLVVIALGATNRYRNVRRLADTDRPLRRIAGVELVAVAGILALTATLTSLAPPQTATAVAGTTPADSVTMTGSDFATTVAASVTVSPGLPGPNLYRATLTAYGTDQPFAADAVTLQLHSVTAPDLPGASVELRADTDGWVAQALDPSVAGTYEAGLQVRTGASVATIPLVLITRSTGTISTTPAPDGETVATGSFPFGVTVQASSSAGSPTQVHLTAFAPNGTELPIRGAVLVATPATGAPQRQTVQRFSAGHFASNATLAAGTWMFDAVLTGRDGRSYQITWQAPAG